LPFAKLEFDLPRLRDPVTALTYLRVKLEREFDIGFAEFDMTKALLAASEGGAEEELVNLSPSAQAALALVEATLALPVSATKDALSHVWVSIRGRFPGLEERLRRAGGTDRVLELRCLDAKELLRQMLRAFVRNLCVGLPPRGGKACRCKSVPAGITRIKWGSGTHNPSAEAVHCGDQMSCGPKSRTRTRPAASGSNMGY